MMKTLISAAPELVPIVYDILEKDGNHEYGLQYNVDYGVIRTTHFKAFDYIDDVIVVQKVDEERSHWWFKAFEPGKGYWDGTSLLPDKGKIGFLNFDALFKASLFHDVVYKKAEAISKATGIPVAKILAFADDMLKILGNGYGATNILTDPIHTIVRFGGSLYHKIKKYLSVVVVAFLCNGLIGCYSIQTEMENENPPDIHWIGPVFTSLTNDIGHILINSTNEIDSSSIPSVPNHQETSGITPETSHEQTDASSS